MSRALRRRYGRALGPGANKRIVKSVQHGLIPTSFAMMGAGAGAAMGGTVGAVFGAAGGGLIGSGLVGALEMADEEGDE